MSNPCDNPPSWPLAPQPEVNPLLTMAWATGTVKDRFGCTRNQNTKFHGGVDLQAQIGTDCFAVRNGKITMVGEGLQLGKYVALAFEEGGRTIGVGYCHLKSIKVVDGQKVRAGEKLGETGITGNASADNPHLHLEVHNKAWRPYSTALERSQVSLNPNNWVTGRS